MTKEGLNCLKTKKRRKSYINCDAELRCNRSIYSKEAGKNFTK